MTLQGTYNLPQLGFLAPSPSLLGQHIASAQAEAAMYPEFVVKLMNDQGKILFASISHQQLLGHHPDQLHGRTLNELIAPEDISHSDLAIEDAVLNGQATEIGFR